MKNCRKSREYQTASLFVSYSEIIWRITLLDASGFIGGNETYEGALKMAQEALKFK